MKITKLLFVCLLALLFACSEDEKSPARPTPEKLSGTWDMTAVDYSGTTTTSFAGNNAKATFTGKGKNIDYSTAFFTDPNTVEGQGSYTIELKTKFAGETTTEDYDYDEAFMSGTWELDGNKLIITNDGESQEAEITKITDDVLVVKVKYNESGSAEGMTITTKITVVYKFGKSDA